MSKAARTSDLVDKGKVETAKVRRYWAGKAPEWATQEQVEQLQISDRDVVRTEVAAPVIVRKADPRLARLAASRSGDMEEARERHREIRAAEIVRRAASSEPGADEEGSDREASPDDEQPQRRPSSHQEEEEEDEDEVLRRRQAVRERLLQQQREAELLQQQQQQDDEEDEDEGDESEYETDTDDEGPGTRLLKPVFVPKQARETIAERERLEAEEEALVEYDRKRQEERKLETRELLRAVVEADDAAAKAAEEAKQQGNANPDDIDTDDEAADETVEFEAWRLRELARIKKARDEAEKQAREAAERDRLRNMTDEERRAWEAANPRPQPGANKKKWKFMQKYWHKGAFFQEDADDARDTVGKDSILDRDYSAPTGEDKFNKEILPKVMQVRNFGRAGRTKWTHLLAEDTMQATQEPLTRGTNDRKRMGGMGSGSHEFAKPKKFKT